jgi:hypothetical protein
MSTTTNFKRIALVAVAALGLGVLSSVPSQAVINSDLLALSATTATQTTAETYTATSATVTLSFFGDVADSASVTAALVSAPAGNTALPVLRLVETSSATVDTQTPVGTTADKLATGGTTLGDGILANTASAVVAISASVTTSAKYAIYLATSGATTAAPAKAGTYVVKITPAAIGSRTLVAATAQTLTITVSTASSLDKNISAANSKYFIQGGSDSVAVPIVDSVVAGTNVAGNKVGYIYVNQINAAGAAASESLTAVITGAGTLGTGIANASVGRSISVKVGDTITVWSDGTSGVGTITVSGSTSGISLGSKTVTFYGAMAALGGTVNSTILAVGANTAAVSVGATDSAKAKINALNTSTASEAIYAFSSDTTIATVPSTAVSYSVDSAVVTVTGVKAGTATITFGNASTLAASTIKSTAVSVRVGSTAVASVTVAFDKATYAPGEKATITLSLKDSTGLLVTPSTYELWASTYGLTSAKSFSQGTGPAATETAVATSALTGLKTYTVYMPVTAGVVTLTGTLAKSLDADYAPIGTLKTAAAIQGTAVTATATVTDSGSAALAAVTALATTVASLRTLIVTLTNLVLKIQKKVKA